MNEFIITLLFGWLGVHKFMQKKYGLGILYVCTFGLFGIGWLIDTITAFMRMTNGKQQTPETQQSNIFSGGGGTRLRQQLNREIEELATKQKIYSTAT